MEAANKNEQIFEKTAELVKSGEFNSQVLEFIKKFADKFNSEEEENTHEHYQLHKDYVYILENLIEVQLKNDHGFTQEEIKTFYETFADNKAGYEAKDSEAFDVLYGFVDFNKFKSTMLEFKASNITDQTEKEIEDAKAAEQIETDEHQKDAYEKFLALFNEDYTDPKSKDWSKKLDIKDWKECEKGAYKITVYQKKAKKGVDFLRTDAQLKGIPAEAMAHYYMNPPESEMLKEVEVLEKSDDGTSCIVYWRFKMPLMSDRDNIAKIH